MWAWDGAEIGRIVKREREKRDQHIWTQRFLAKKAGVSHAYVSHLEAGLYKRPSREKVESILSALGLDIRSLSGEVADGGQRLIEARGDYNGGDPRIDQINAHLLTMRALDDDEVTQVEAIIRSMVEDLLRRRRDRENAQRP